MYSFLSTDVLFPAIVTGNPSTNLNEELRKDKQKVLDNRATEYWMRAWQIPEVRRQIAKADRVYIFL